jgi:hypothetical protein
MLRNADLQVVIMPNIRGRSFGFRVYELVDPRNASVRYVGCDTGDAPWDKPKCHARSDLAAWLTELATVELAPLVEWPAAPTWYPRDAARWLARSRRLALIDAGMTVLTGYGPAWQRPGRSEDQPPLNRA